MTMAAVNQMNNIDTVKVCAYCTDCVIHRNLMDSLEIANEFNIELNQNVCEKCNEGDNWTPCPGDERFMIDDELLVKGVILIDEENFEHEILEVLTKNMKPSLLKVQHELTPDYQYIRVEDTVYYSVKEVD